MTKRKALNKARDCAQLQALHLLHEQRLQLEAQGRVEDARRSLTAARRESLDAETYWRTSLRGDRFDPNAEKRAAGELVRTHEAQRASQSHLDKCKQEMEDSRLRLANAKARNDALRQSADRQARDCLRDAQHQQELALSDRFTLQWWHR